MEKLTAKQAELVGNAFEKHGYLIKQVVRKFTSNKESRLDAGDLESYLNEKFIESVLRFNASKSNNLGAYLNVRLTQHALNFINTGYAKYNAVSEPFSAIDAKAQDTSDDGDVDPFEVTDDFDLEGYVLKRQEIKRVLDKLFTKATDVQRRIMEYYLKAEGKVSYTQVGKALGLHHETVKRELAKLARMVDFDLSFL